MRTDLNFVHSKQNRPQTHSIIWLHGLGSNGHDFVSMVENFPLYDNVGMHFILPHAPTRPISINQNMPMPAWYDITGFELEDREDLAGMTASAAGINQLIQQECAKGIPEKNIFLAGFSQGGAMALYTGLTYPKKLAGIMALSCYLPVRNQLQDQRSLESLQTPILQIHGDADLTVKYAWGEMSRALLSAWGYSVEWSSFSMGHELHLEAIIYIHDWVRQQLN